MNILFLLPNIQKILEGIANFFVDLGEIVIAVEQLDMWLFKCISFLTHLPWPLMIAASIGILFLMETIKHVAMAVAGAWIAIFMSITQVRVLGIILFVWGLGCFFIFDISNCKSFMRQPKRFKKLKEKYS